MKASTTVAALAILGAISLSFTFGADKPALPIGSAEFVPTPERPIGARGDGMGNYEGATPPIEWWAGTPIQRDVMLQPQSSQWDVPADKPTKAWDQADNKPKNILWKVPVVGWGYAHPIVVGKRLYTVGHPYWVACYDADSGKELWKKAMTPMVAAGMEAEKAEKLRKVVDLALALSVRAMGDDYKGSPFLFGSLTKREQENPEQSVKLRIETCEKALAMIAKFRPDVEAFGDPKLVAALDYDASEIEGQIKEIKAAASPQVAAKDVCKLRDRGYGALKKALAEGYDIPLNWAWYGFVGFADASLASDGERIYGTLAQGQMFCYDLDGNRLWSRQDGGRNCGNYYNFNRPPLVADGVVCIRLQAADKTTKLHHWVGFDAKTGKITWEVPFGGPRFCAPLTITLTDPAGKAVNAFVTHSPGKTVGDDTEHGPAVIRARDGMVLGYCPNYYSGRGSHLTWHDGILVCSAGTDGHGIPPFAFRVKMTGADAVSTELIADADKYGRCVPNGEEFAIGFGPYRFHGNKLADMRTFKQMSTIPWVRETATKVGSYLVGRGGGHGLAGATTYRTKRADCRAMDCFQVVDLSDVRNPRLLSNRNVLSFTEPPADHIMATYLADRDPLIFAGCYQGAPSYFGTDMSGVVGHGDRIYLQSAAFLYCIGPAVKGTPKDDPKVVAAIRAGKSVDEVAKYLESDSAQYRYEVLRRFVKPETGNLKPETQKVIENLARTDAYEEIRTEALRVLGLETGKPGFAVLKQAITNEIVAHHESHTHQGLGDTVATLRALGTGADPVLVAMLTDADSKVRRTAAAAAGLWPSGGALVRDALVIAAADRSTEQAARSHGIAAAEALSNWPADPAVTLMFTKILDDAKDWWFHRAAVRYLMRALPEDQKNAVLVKAARAWNGQNNTGALVERGAVNEIKTLVTETKDRIQAGIIQALCSTAVASDKPELRKFAAEMGVLALTNPPADLYALGGIANALKSLGADAAPVLPMLKALKPEELKDGAKPVAETIAEIEAKVAAAASEKK